jgi:hypothetical protein
MHWRWKQHVPPKRLYSYVTSHNVTFQNIPHSPLRGKPQISDKSYFFFYSETFQNQCNFTPTVCSFDRPWKKTRLWDSSRSLCQQHWVQLRVVPSTTWRKWVLYADVSAYGFTWMERTPVGNIHSFCCLSYDRSKHCPKRVLHRLRSSASPFSFQYPRFSLR